MRRLLAALVALFLSAAQAQGPILPGPGLPAASASNPFAIDGTAQHANATAASVALPAFTTSFGDDIVYVAVITNGGPVTSVTGCSLTFTRRTSQFNAGQTTELWSASASSTLSSCAVTVNVTSSAFTTGCIFAFSGAHFSSPFDSNASIPAKSTATASLGMTTSNANDILVGMELASGGTDTAGSGWTLIYGGTGSTFLAVEYQSVAATNTYHVTFGSATSAQMIGDAIIKGP